MRAKKLLIRLIQSKKGFSLLEVLASAMVILSVSATVSHLSSHPKVVTKGLERKWALVNFMHAKLQDLNQASTPIPTTAIRYCSTCNNTLPGCDQICASSSEYTTDCPVGTTVDNELNAIGNNANACYVSVVLDPTCDNEINTTQSQICAGGRIRKNENPENGDTEYAVSTFLFRS